MNTREFYAVRLTHEKPIFLRVISAIPSDKAAYRPHPRSNSAADIAWQLACEFADSCEVVEHGKVDYVVRPAPTVAESAAAYEKNVNELEKLVSGLDDAAWERPAKFLMNGTPVWEAPLGDMLFGILVDAIHHRGQLSAYLRPMGAKVPSIYGPSADDSGQ